MYWVLLVLVEFYTNHCWLQTLRLCFTLLNTQKNSECMAKIILGWIINTFCLKRRIRNLFGLFISVVLVISLNSLGRPSITTVEVICDHYSQRWFQVMSLSQPLSKKCGFLYHKKCSMFGLSSLMWVISWLKNSHFHKSHKDTCDVLWLVAWKGQFKLSALHHKSESQSMVKLFKFMRLVVKGMTFLSPLSICTIAAVIILPGVILKVD